MDGRAQQPEGFAAAFESAFARLQVLLEMACVGEKPWPERAALAIRQALEFAATDAGAAIVLTSGALAEGADGAERYERLMTYLAGLLEAGRGESPHGTELPPSTERSLVGGVATIVASRVDHARGAELSGLATEMIQFVLTPYIGTEEAMRLAKAGDWPDGQLDR